MAGIDWATSLTEVGTALGLVATLAGAGWAVFQYWQNSRDQRAERARTNAVTAANEIEMFHNDTAVQSAMSMIDYCEVPDTGTSGTAPLFVNPTLFAFALRNHADGIVSLTSNPGAEKSDLFTISERRIRDLIDAFLGRLERIDNLIAKGVIDKDDFERLFFYWLQLMGEVPLKEDTLAHFDDVRRRALWRFIRTYRFDGVVRLFERYGRAACVATDPEIAFKSR
ncbi:hypothetical protein ACYG9R_17815 [Mesorhizobium sp. RSR565B]|uniref:hypothetical protein n=1 Tax=unclassified Mesorhizobium TaxID=325217 RepID=UPI0003CF5E49|nr:MULTISPECIES: hypothetical protein [unclassified Mesorhizobium]ESW67188.1 hypothetical protein X771_15075 [Mesorhizobium sp. LSJC277A00]ESZ50864.1 hypothetical protein X730_05680 [Mesorhizobium sp. L103C565B0]